MSALLGMSRIVSCNGNACAFTEVFIWQEICRESNTCSRVTVTELFASKTILMKYYTCLNQERLSIITIIFFSILKRESWTLTCMFSPFSTFTFLHSHFPSRVVLCFFHSHTAFSHLHLCAASFQVLYTPALLMHQHLDYGISCFCSLCRTGCIT